MLRYIYNNIYDTYSQLYLGFGGKCQRWQSRHEKLHRRGTFLRGMDFVYCHKRNCWMFHIGRHMHRYGHILSLSAIFLLNFFYIYCFDFNLSFNFIYKICSQSEFRCNCSYSRCCLSVMRCRLSAGYVNDPCGAGFC